MAFDFSAPHAPFVLAAYGLMALFLLGFGLHGLICFFKSRTPK